MKRREFITLIGGAAASPLAARAQQPAKMKRIAMVSPSEPVANLVASYHRFYRAFFDELSRLGFVEGKTLIVERYSGEGRQERLPQLARDVVATSPDVIYALDGQTSLQFKSATTTIPIVSIAADPVAMGIVTSIVRPGGNITGVSADAGIGLYVWNFERGSSETVQRLRPHDPKYLGWPLRHRCPRCGQRFRHFFEGRSTGRAN
jgi:putative ABC transport system substrate-binding protein